MMYYRCKCGDREAFGSMSPDPCAHCTKCGTDLAPAPNLHKPVQIHVLKPYDVEEDDGLGILHRCKWCHLTKKQIEAEGEKWEFENLPESDKSN